MTIWNPDLPSIAVNSSETVGPRRSLYDYDGPLLFVVDGIMGKQLFYKIEELSNGAGYFIAAATTTNVVDSLEKGNLSIKGALFEGGSHRIVELSPDYRVKRYWEQRIDDLDESFLPESGVGLSPGLGSVPDTLNQATSFLSVKLSGISLHKGTVSFASYNSIVSNVYTAFRSILSSAYMDARDFRLEFPLHRPAFGSVVISIEQPYAKLRRNKENKNEDYKVAYQRIEDEVRKSRDQFMTDMSGLLLDVRKGDLTAAGARQHSDVLHQISAIVPSEAKMIDYAEFNAVVSGSVKSLFVNEETGDRISRAFKLVERIGRTFNGPIVEINAPSQTLIMMHRDRQLTCVFRGSVFEEIRRKMDTYKIGVRISVKGRFEERKRRDRIFTNELPEVIG